MTANRRIIERHRPTNPGRHAVIRPPFPQALAALLLVIFAMVSPVRAQNASGIEIVGERTAKNARQFRWTITNNGNTPIIRFRVPRYLSSEVIPPPGWTGVALEGEASGNGDVEFTADSNRDALRPGQTLVFEIHDRRLRGSTKHKTATIELLGGEILTIEKVACPGPESFVEKNIPLIGLTSMFAIFLLVQALRKRRHEAQQADSPSTDSGSKP